MFNGVAAVPLVYAIVTIASNPKFMGRWRSSLPARLWGWFTFGLMGLAVIAMFALWNQQ